MADFSNFRATDITQTGFTLRWSNCSVSLPVRITIETIGTGAVASLNRAPGTESEVRTGLTSNTGYRCTLAIGRTEAEITVTTLSSGTAPDAPSDMAGSTRSPTSILWTWTDNSDDEEAFELEITNETDGTTTLVDTLADVESFLATSLPTAKVFSARVRAVRGSFVSEWSNVARAATYDVVPQPGVGTFGELPDAPYDVEVTVTGADGARVTWNNVNLFFDTQAVVLADADGVVLRNRVVPNSQRAYQWSGLTQDTTYLAYITVTNATGPASSEPVTFTTDRARRNPPTAPTTLDVTVSVGGSGSTDGIVTLTFRGQTNADALTVERDTVPTSGSFTVLTTTLSPLADAYDDGGLGAGNTYVYRMRSTQADGTASSYITSDNVTIPAVLDEGSFPAPTNHVIEPFGPDGLLATWDYIGGVNINSFAWDISAVSSSGPWTTIDDEIPGTARSMSLTGLVENQLYYSRIRAIGDLSNSISNVASATTNTSALRPAPVPPQSVQVVVAGPRVARVRWTPSDDSAETFAILRAGAGVTPLAVVQSGIGATVREFDMTGLTPNTQYDVAVRATNDAGSGDSDRVTFQTRSDGSSAGAGSRDGAFAQTGRDWKKDDADVTLADGTRSLRIVAWHAAAADATDGPIVELFQGDTILTPTDSGGVSALVDRIVPAGDPLTMVVRGTGTGTSKHVCLIEYL